VPVMEFILLDGEPINVVVDGRVHELNMEWLHDEARDAALADGQQVEQLPTSALFRYAGIAL
jgi:hypothetical protein